MCTASCSDEMSRANTIAPDHSARMTKRISDVLVAAMSPNPTVVKMVLMK